MKPVMVTWFDAVSQDEWAEIQDAKGLELHTIQTLGWLISEDDRKIVMAASWDVEREGVASTWAIPKTWLVDIREINIE